MRKVQSLNRNWRFHLGDEVGADYMGHDDRAWPEVTLPHDWSVAYPFDKRNASGTGYLPEERPGTGNILFCRMMWQESGCAFALEGYTSTHGCG